MHGRHRVLFFVEPYCVRSGPDDFRIPFEVFWQIAAALGLEADVETALVGPRALACRKPAVVRCFCPADAGLDETMAADWMPNWTRMLRGEDVGSWGAFYRGVLSEFQPTLVYIWNKNTLFQSVCRAAGVPVLTFEYGGVRTPSGFRISVDPRGFGPESAAAVEPLEACSQQAVAGWDWAATHIYHDALLLYRPAQRSDRGGALQVCLLLQKEDDVNFLVWPAFPDMWSFVEQTLQALHAVSSVHTTVRAHPAGLADYTARLAERFPAVHVDDGTRNFYEAMLDYDCVLTLNSAAGFEALACGIPAMTFATSFYQLGFVSAPEGPSIADFIEAVRQRTFWSSQRRDAVGTFLHRLIQNYSIPLAMLRQPSFHLALMRTLANRSSADVDAWFRQDPPALAAVVRGCETAMLANQVAGLQTENHRRAGSIDQLARELDATARELRLLNVERLRHEQVLADMTRHNEPRDKAIDALQQQVHQHVQTLAAMTQASTARDAAIADVNEVLAAMTRQNETRDQAIGALQNEVHRHRLALAEMTKANTARDEAIAALNQTTADLSRRTRDDEAAVAQHRDSQEREILEWRRQIATLQTELADLRRRSLRIPQRLYERVRRLFGGRRPAC